MAIRRGRCNTQVVGWPGQMWMGMVMRVCVVVRWHHAMECQRWMMRLHNIAALCVWQYGGTI